VDPDPDSDPDSDPDPEHYFASMAMAWHQIFGLFYSSGSNFSPDDSWTSEVTGTSPPSKKRKTK
jgi:hypothetical protein